MDKKFNIQFSFVNERYDLDIENINKDLTLQEASNLMNYLKLIKCFMNTFDSECFDSIEEQLSHIKDLINFRGGFKIKIHELQLDEHNMSLINFKGVILC